MDGQTPTAKEFKPLRDLKTPEFERGNRDKSLKYNGRSERIRTSDPLLPKQVRYQAALRSDTGRVIAECRKLRNRIQTGIGADSDRHKGGA